MPYLLDMCLQLSSPSEKTCFEKTCFEKTCLRRDLNSGPVKLQSRCQKIDDLDRSATGPTLASWGSDP